jgi:parvulin-like peptidyl-prolyl isomerase
MSQRGYMKFLAILFLSTIALAQNDKTTTTNNDPVVAVVNNVKITKSDLKEAIEQALLVPTNKKLTTESVLDFLINRQVVINKAMKDKLDQDEYVKDRMNDVLFGAVISKDLDKQVSEIKVTDKDVEQYYKTNKEYRTSHILIRLEAMPKKEDVTKAYQVINTLYEQVKKDPKQFEALAKQYSEIAASNQGGDIGFLPPTSLMPEYFEAIKGKSVNFITPPVRTQYGYHIIKITGIKDFKEIDMNLYKKIVFDIKRDQILENYYQTVRKTNTITVYKENLP